MDEYRKILIDLVQKCKDTLTKNPEYVSSVKLLKKINKSIINDNPENVKIDYDKIISLSQEEMSLFTSPICERIVTSLPHAIKKHGITGVSILKNIRILEEDLLNNKIKEHTLKIKKFDALLDIINNNINNKNYKLILDFIELSLNNKLIDIKTAINLNFYVLRKYNNLNVDVDKEKEAEVVRLVENRSSIEDIRKQLEETFNKYGYSYDILELDKCGGEENFVKYSKITYVDYILAKFKRYGISQKELYAKKAFYNIVIDNDKRAFNSILDFVDHNECSLSRVLYFPAVFSRRVREYVMKNVSTSSTNSTVKSGGTTDKNIKITGCNIDFLKNVELYKELKGIDTVNDEDLNELGVYLSTPHEIVKRNLELLLKYRVVDPGKLPESISSLCGKRTEYLLDRFIESSIYEDYLLPRINKKDEVKGARGTSLLHTISTPLIFYKIKRANDLGESLFHANMGLKNIFTKDNIEYSGISISEDNKRIVQDMMPMEVYDEIDVDRKKYLPNGFYPKDDISWENSYRITYRNLYQYKTFLPSEIFKFNKIKGNLIDKIFERDYLNVIKEDDNIVNDPFVKLLDNALYCDLDGNTKPIKNTELQYVFTHSLCPNISLVISRYKVLRLCKLLKDNKCFINENSSLLEKTNILLSVLLKDTIVSDYEMVMLRTALTDILTTGLVKVDSTENVHLERRVVR